MKDYIKATIDQIIHLQTTQCYREAETLCSSLLMQLPKDSHNLSIRVSLQNRLIAILEAQSRYDEALTFAQIALINLETFKLELSSKIVITLEVITLSNIGKLERILGQYANAEQVYLKAISLSENQSTNHQQWWMRLSNDLAIVYKYWGKFDKAEQIYQGVLASLLQQYGEHHIVVATVYHNLAGLNHSRRRYVEAEPLARKSYLLHLELLGENHPRTIADGAALGSILHGLQRWDEAILLFEKAITYFNGELNFDAYEVAINLNNIAASFQAKGNLEKAEQAYKQALDIKKNLFGAEHPDVAISLNNLALLLKQKGKIEASQALFEQAMRIFEKTIGLEHPHTRLCQENSICVTPI